MSRTVRPSIWLQVLVLAACGRADAPADAAADRGPGLIGCSADARPGVEVAVTDGRTGAALGGFTVVLASDPAGPAPSLDSSTVAAQPPQVWRGALERAGRFSLRVTKARYLPWDTTGVVVTRDECHVQTVRLDVRLMPQS